MAVIENPFRTYMASTTAEFLEYLRLSNPVWRGIERGWQHPWLFRGQGSASWPLIPSNWRSDEHSAISSLLSSFVRKQDVDHDKEVICKVLSRGESFRGYDILDDTVDNAVQLYYRTRLELSLLDSWLDQLLLRGVNVPEHMRTRTFLNRYLGNPLLIVEQLAGKDHYELDRSFQNVIHNNSIFALAQHHGIPTRLLDWTKSAYIAAFFAAEDALRSNHPDKYLAVFAVHQSLLNSRHVLNFPFPRSDNPYLHAQQGELTLYDASSHYLMFGEYPSVDQLLDEESDWEQEIQPIKLILPTDKSPELLRLLSIYEGIARDQLMPTLDNIAYVVNQRYLLDLSD